MDGKLVLVESMINGEWSMVNVVKNEWSMVNGEWSN
jgi:hypothetical protein